MVIPFRTKQACEFMKMQHNINEWKTVEKQIERSKIKRYPYKKYLGISLTELILGKRNEGKDAEVILIEIMASDKMKRLISDHILERDAVLNNVWISICARCSEKRTQDKIRRNTK